MELILLLPFILSFAITILLLPLWIKKARNIGLLWEDMNKKDNKKDVAGSGGLIVITGFTLSVLFYIAIKTFYLNSNENIVEIFALTTTILLLSLIGIVDDLLGWHSGGLSKKFRLLLCIFAAVPLMVINAGNGEINLPILGIVNLGVLYPLFLIPLGIVATSTTFNFLAGFNGLEASQGIILLSGMSLIAYLTGSSWITIIGLCMIFSLIAFWIFNRNPASIFPGDVLTYPIGGLIGIMAILGNFEKIALIFYIPYIIEVILKARGKLHIQSFGKPNKDNSLELPYSKIYGMTHFSIWFLKKFKRKVYENEVVILINVIQILFILIGVLIFIGNVL